MKQSRVEVNADAACPVCVPACQRKLLLRWGSGMRILIPQYDCFAQCRFCEVIMLDEIVRHIARQRDRIIDWQRAMTALPALGPENGGQGEADKAAYLSGVLRDLGLAAETIHAPDDRVQSGSRPNLVARVPGRDPRTLWLLGHMDVVPPGDPALWRTDPWTATVDGDRIYGRGVEDNQQAIVCGLLVAQALRALDATPDLTLGLMFAADEETGNARGIKHLLTNRPDLFGKDDMLLAPDYGVNTGDQICVAEKSQLWLKITVNGRQGHAARPAMARNALIAAARMIVRTPEALGQAYPDTHSLFEAEPASTFTPTRHEANVPNVNTIPGREVFYMDCRVLEGYNLDKVVDTARTALEATAQESGVEVAVEVVQANPAAPGACVDSLLVRRLSRGIREIYQVEPRPVGSGGGTVAGAARGMGLTAVAWARIMPTCHEPNECSSIANTIGDAQVMATMLFARSLPDA
jgi:succinyl-diaminopimelate desuccinylase